MFFWRPVSSTRLLGWCRLIVRSLLGNSLCLSSRQLKNRLVSSCHQFSLHSVKQQHACSIPLSSAVSFATSPFLWSISCLSLNTTHQPFISSWSEGSTCCSLRWVPQMQTCVPKDSQLPGWEIVNEQAHHGGLCHLEFKLRDAPNRSSLIWQRIRFFVYARVQILCEYCRKISLFLPLIYKMTLRDFLCMRWVRWSPWTWWRHEIWKIMSKRVLCQFLRKKSFQGTKVREQDA